MLVEIKNMINKSENSWFAEWFDTTYYHQLYKHRDDAEAELFMRNITDLLHLAEDNHILDLACGKGRHAQFLSTLGYRVTGVDLSANSIGIANQHSTDRLTFDVHDMREVYRKDEFDAVFNLFTSFGYFDSQSDNLKVLNSIRDMLKEDGVLVIDFMNAERVIRNLIPQETKIVDDIEFHIERKYDGTHIFKNIQFDDENQHFDFTERVQAVKLNDFEVLLEKAGFDVLNRLGNYKLDSFNAEMSDRLILVARKK